MNSFASSASLVVVLIVLLASLPINPLYGLIGLSLAVSGRWSAVAPFWGLTTTFLSGTAAAGSIALINAIGNLGGYFGPQIMGWLKDMTGSYEMGLRILSGLVFLGGAAVTTVKIKSQATPLSTDAQIAEAQS